jgi:hypothetical protein
VTLPVSLVLPAPRRHTVHYSGQALILSLPLKVDLLISASNKIYVLLVIQEKVWAKWVSIDDVLAERLGIQPGSKNIPREILIEVGRGSDDDPDDPGRTKIKPEEESGNEGTSSPSK